MATEHYCKQYKQNLLTLWSSSIGNFTKYQCFTSLYTVDALFRWQKHLSYCTARHYIQQISPESAELHKNTI